MVRILRIVALPLVTVVAMVNCLLLMKGAPSWPIAHDIPLLHFVASELLSGKVLFRDTLELNMPFTVLIHALNIVLFGRGDEGWRIFQLLWFILTTVSFVVLLRRFTIFAGLLAASLYGSIVLAQGYWVVGQRDYLIVPFIVFSLTLFCSSLRRSGDLQRMGVAGVLMGCAAAIKPHYFLLVVLLSIWMLALERNRLSLLRLAVLLGSSLLPWLLILGWLSLAGGFTPFLDFLTSYLLPLYPELGRYPVHSVTEGLLAILTPFLPLVLLRSSGDEPEQHEESGIVLLCTGCAVMFLLQGKSWTYQALPTLAMLSLFASLQISDALRNRHGIRIMNFVPIALTLFLSGPLYIERDSRPVPDLRRVEAMMKSINENLPPGGTIQTLDLTGGALNALYRLQLPMATRFTYDFYLYTRITNPYVRKLQREFLEELTKAHPALIVISSYSWPELALGYGKIDRIIGLQDLLASDYTIVVDRPDYRVYRAKAP